jgi:NAD(P)-dependent dehydrogenase (short-subunit alcohol dehydrogenase family)
MTRYPRIDLDGALVVITGAARGIGLSTAKEFVAAGARVALGDLDDTLAREAAAGLGESASGHRLDVTDKQSYAAAPLVPEPVMRLLRRAVHDDAAITRVDSDVRRAYLDRIETQ